MNVSQKQNVEADSEIFKDCASQIHNFELEDFNKKKITNKDLWKKSISLMNKKYDDLLKKHTIVLSEN